MIGSNPTYEGKYLSFLLQEERKSDRILILCFKVIRKEEVPLARGRRAILGHFASEICGEGKSTKKIKKYMAVSS